MIITWGDHHLRCLPKFDFYIRISNFLCDELNLYYQACVTVLRSYLIGTVKLFKLKVSSNVKSNNLPWSMVKSSWWLNWPVLKLVELFFCFFLFNHLIPHLILYYFFELRDLGGYRPRWVVQSRPCIFLHCEPASTHNHLASASLGSIS